jgi:hypothetical protein
MASASIRLQKSNQCRQILSFKPSRKYRFNPGEICSNLGDESGRPLDGANKYTLNFDKGNTPP